MAIILVKHNVKEYSTWRKVYDEHKAFRIKSGMQSEKVMRSTTDPNQMFLLFKWDNIMNAKIFTQSEDLKKVMQNAGVIGKPEMHFLEEAGQLTEKGQLTPPRSMIEPIQS